jgi:hypothetical protein
MKVLLNNGLNYANQPLIKFPSSYWLAQFDCKKKSVKDFASRNLKAPSRYLNNTCIRIFWKMLNNAISGRRDPLKRAKNRRTKLINLCWAHTRIGHLRKPPGVELIPCRRKLLRRTRTLCDPAQTQV